MFIPNDFADTPHCEAVVVTCIDFRFQRLFERWLHENFDQRYYNRVAYAGGVLNWDLIFPMIEFSERVHRVKRVILINHEDCRAYGDAGTPVRHVHDLHEARKRILQAYPDLIVELYYARLAGYMDHIT
ncbi:MAG: hypothetical protein IT324_20420 [Anaerolineae bacterium]|nr:hypothetical protein [Anaerolineae bacterium]